MSEEIFLIGHYYEHSGGGKMHIVGDLYTRMWGHCLVAEDLSGYLKPVGWDTTSAVNWHEISREEYFAGVDDK